jgi:hypothetical protein
MEALKRIFFLAAAAGLAAMSIRAAYVPAAITNGQSGAVLPTLNGGLSSNFVVASTSPASSLVVTDAPDSSYHGVYSLVFTGSGGAATNRLIYRLDSTHFYHRNDSLLYGDFGIPGHNLHSLGSVSNMTDLDTQLLAFSDTGDLPSGLWQSRDQTELYPFVRVYFASTNAAVAVSTPFVFPVATVDSGTRYVASYGDNQNNGLSWAYPMQSITWALKDTAVSNIIVGPGTFQEQVILRANTTVRGAGMGRTLLVSNEGTGGYAAMHGSNGCVIEDLTFTGQFGTPFVDAGKECTFRRIESLREESNIDSYVGGVVAGVVNMEDCYLHGSYDIFAFVSGIGGTINLRNCRMVVNGIPATGFPAHGFSFNSPVTNCTLNFIGGSMLITNTGAPGSGLTNCFVEFQLGTCKSNTVNVYGTAIKWNADKFRLVLDAGTGNKVAFHTPFLNFPTNNTPSHVVSVADGSVFGDTNGMMFVMSNNAWLRLH